MPVGRGGTLQGLPHLSMIKDWTHANRHVSSTVESFRSQSISCRGAIYNSFQLPRSDSSFPRGFPSTTLQPRMCSECTAIIPEITV